MKQQALILSTALVLSASVLAQHHISHKDLPSSQKPAKELGRFFNHQIGHFFKPKVSPWQSFFNFQISGLNMQQVSQTYPTPHSTHTQVRWANCINHKAAILGEFCVHATDSEMEKDPSNKLPRISVYAEPQAPSKLTVFMFSQEDKAFARIVFSGLSSCETMAHVASAALWPDKTTGHVTGSRSLRGKANHKWFIVGVDCSSHIPSCSNVSLAEIDFFHPNSNGDMTGCGPSGMVGSVMNLKSFMKGAWQSMDFQHMLDVAGISSFGVVLLYLGTVVMFGSCMLFFGVAAWENDEGRRQVYLRCCFTVGISAMAYLALATGNGLLILRKVGPGATQGWVYSNTMMDYNPSNPNGGAEGDRDPTYPLLYLRYLDMLISSPLILYNLCVLVDAPAHTVQMLLFCNCCMIACFFQGAATTTPSKWVFWLLGCVFTAAVVGILSQVLWDLSLKRGRPTRRLFQKLHIITVATWAVFPFLWIGSDGTKALPIDVTLMTYLGLDVMSKCTFGLIMLRNVRDVALPKLFDMGTNLESVPGTVGYEDEGQ